MLTIETSAGFSNEWQCNSDQDLEVLLSKKTEFQLMIDGSLSEAVWKEAIQLGNFTEVLPRECAKPPVNTKVFLMYDDKNLYIGFICYENDISTIRITHSKRDRFNNNDCVGIMVDPFNQLQKAYKFLVNPYGVQKDGLLYSTGQSDLSFDTYWESAAQIFDNRWEVEIKIPFKSFKFPHESNQHWRLYLGRSRPRTSVEEYSWSPISRDNPSLLSQFGHLYIKNLNYHKQIVTFLPYLIYSQSRYLSDPANPEALQSESPKGKIGITGKYRISSNITLDWAIRPDFAQIETDALQIDVNTTFALAYPEKRPLFMEGSDIFGTPINAIYTRSINDPIAALKLTGKVGKTSIGYIGAYDEYTPWVIPFKEYSFPVASEEKSLSNIIRVRQSILEESYIGLLTTSRDINESFSRVAGIDGNIRFLQNYFLEFQVLRSWYNEPADASVFPGYKWLIFEDYTSTFDGEKFTGIAYTIDFSRFAKVWCFRIWNTAFSPTFRADNGFINKNDFKETGIWTSLNFNPNKWIFEKINPQLNLWRRYDYAGNFRKEYIHPSFNITFKKQTAFSLFYTLSSAIFMDTKFDNIWTTGGQISTDFSNLISGGIWGQYGRGINYYASPVALSDICNISLWLILKPTSRFSSSFDFERYWLRESEGGKEAYDVTVFQNKTSYQFTKYFSIRLVTQYQSDSKNIGIYPLISFEPNPFTVFYLGSNHALNKFNEPYGYIESERQVFLKFQYFFEY